VHGELAVADALLGDGVSEQLLGELGVLARGLLFTGLTAVTITLWATDPTYALTNPASQRYGVRGWLQQRIDWLTSALATCSRMPSSRSPCVSPLRRWRPVRWCSSRQAR
jgi:hypothetical protein